MMMTSLSAFLPSHLASEYFYTVIWVFFTLKKGIKPASGSTQQALHSEPHPRPSVTAPWRHLRLEPWDCRLCSVQARVQIQQSPGPCDHPLAPPLTNRLRPCKTLHLVTRHVCRLCLIHSLLSLKQILVTQGLTCSPEHPVVRTLSSQACQPLTESRPSYIVCSWWNFQFLVLYCSLCEADVTSRLKCKTHPSQLIN